MRCPEADFYDLNVPVEHHYFAEGAIHHNSGKTEAVAAIAVAEFLASPSKTKVIVASTTLKDARGRVWGRIEHYWNEAMDFFRHYAIPGLAGGIPMPGDLVSSQGFIRMSMGGRKDDTRGIVLAPGKDSEVKEGIGRMKGFKAPRMRFFADELSDLSHKLLDAAETNLYTNPDFKMIGTFNPASHFDPAGILSEPKDGWDSINMLESEGWKTTRGYCIRFDGETSPNVVAGYEKYPGLLKKEKLEERREALGSNSARFMEQYRGTWSTTGRADAIYTEAELIQHQGRGKVEVWPGITQMCAGFDPSYVHGGDRAGLVIAKTGEGITLSQKRPIMEVVEVIYLDDDLDTTKDKKELVIQRLKEAMRKHNVPAKNLAMDASGGGDPFATLMAQDPFFGTQFVRVQFGGSASELPAPGSGGKIGKDRFYNMASELWHAGKSYLRCGQLKNITPGIAREMTLRLYEEVGKPPKIKIEPKDKMKERLQGKSPDISDSYFLALFAARFRLGFLCAEKVAQTQKPLPIPGNPYSNLVAWGQKKPQALVEHGHVDLTIGAGWDSERAGSGGYSHMFGGSGR